MEILTEIPEEERENIMGMVDVFFANALERFQTSRRAQGLEPLPDSAFEFVRKNKVYPCFCAYSNAQQFENSKTWQNDIMRDKEHFEASIKEDAKQCGHLGETIVSALNTHYKIEHTWVNNPYPYNVHSTCYDLGWDMVNTTFDRKDLNADVKTCQASETWMTKNKWNETSAAIRRGIRKPPDFYMHVIHLAKWDYRIPESERKTSPDNRPLMCVAGVTPFDIFSDFKYTSNYATKVPAWACPVYYDMGYFLENILKTHRITSDGMNVVPIKQTQLDF